MKTTDRRRLVLSALALLLVFGLLMAVFWNPDGDPEAGRRSISRIPHRPPSDRESPGGGKVKPSGPAATALVDSLEKQVGTPLRDSAVGKSAKLGDFRVMEYPLGKPAFTGEPAVAFVSVPSSGDNVAVEPNQIGEFPPVYANPGETVQVGVVFPATRPGTKVRVVAEDGGSLTGEEGQPARVMELDAAQSFSLPFTLGDVEGSYRLTIATAEGEPKRLHLHAGPAMR